MSGPRFLVSLAACLLVLPAWAQPAAPWTSVPPDTSVVGFSIDSADRTRIIDAVIETLEARYVDAENAAAMVDALSERRGRGDYDAIANGWTFATQLTRDLREVSGDLHLGIGFSPLAGGPSLPNPDMAARFGSPPGRERCGFEQVEVLDGGIGYVKVNRFFETNTCSSAAIAVLYSIARSRAIVLDLRDHAGGYIGMNVLIASHLFSRPTRLSTLHWRDSRRTQEYWTKERPTGPRMPDMPLYIVTSSRTFSAGEWLAYDLRALGRAVVVGETTAGAAHTADPARLDERFVMSVPVARPVNPVTGGNWEGTGVVPDVPVAAADAVEVAIALAREALADGDAAKPEQ